MRSSRSMGGEFAFGVRKRESGSGDGGGVDSSSPPTLKVSKDSHRIRKPPLPLPQVQYRPPIIIHTYSPKVIHTEPDDFMTLVQKLTGSSDTRLRLKKDSPSKKKRDKSAAKATAGSENSLSAAVANLERQGSGSTSGTTSCGSPSTSEEDSSFLVSDHSEAATMKQSNSPRSPLDSQFEFDNVSESMFSQFDASTGSPFSSQQVKVEPMFSFGDSNSFSFFADFMQPTPSRAVPVTPPMSTSTRSQIGLVDMGAPLGAIMDQVQQQSSTTTTTTTTGFVSANLMNHGLPDLSPGSAPWSQSFLDCLSAPALSCPAPFPRQRFSGPGYAPIPESSTMVALENIQAFMMT